MQLALLPLNPTVGDLAANADSVVEAVCQAVIRRPGLDLAVLPELVITGYPPRDLLEQEGFVEDAMAEVDRVASILAARTPGLCVVLGTPHREAPDQRPFNAAIVIRDGKAIAVYRKRLLPTYDVFDEHRYFATGDEPCVIDVAGCRVGLAICEDLWKADDAIPGRIGGRYVSRVDPAEDLIDAGAECIVSLSASPFTIGKVDRQRDILRQHCERWRVPVASVNQLGGNDDLIFDGYAAVFRPSDSSDNDLPVLTAANAGFSGDPIDADLGGSPASIAGPLRDESENAMLWDALVLGVRDYARKTGFTRACLGLSGGIDSALTATIAAAALEPANILGCLMPSRYSSEGSIADAEALAANLGVRTTTAPIVSPHEAIEGLLEPIFDDLCSIYDTPREPGITEENIQSRIRGLTMMALSNKFNALLLTTGNKSEIAVGYSTLYGDMNGGLAVIADLTKLRVYALSRWMNDNHTACGFSVPPIPEPSITKPPSAELRPDQKDSDSLPPYEVLDEIVERYVEKHQSPSRIARETGFDEDIIARITRLTDINEYKRKQLAIGLKVTSTAFGRGRRRPIAQRYHPAP
ncbi:MAG: NAD+ synthase [Planctomycetota bacterium]